MKTRVLLFFLPVFTIWMVASTKAYSTLPDPVNAQGYLHQGQFNPDQWKTVDSLLAMGQPRSALIIVNKIYEDTRKQGDTPQFIKAVIYRIRINSEFQEDFLNQTIRDLRGEILKSKEPATSILHSILAEVYWKYYRNNAYRFRDRSRLSVISQDSISTWDLNTIAEAITNEYLRSIQNAQVLKSTPIGSFKEILQTSDKETRENSGQRRKTLTKPEEICPTLYDFLGQRALDFFTVSEGPVNQPATGFCIDRPDFFGPTDKFVQFMGESAKVTTGPLSYDSISTTYLAFRMFQSLAAFHLQDKNPVALIQIEIDRYKFMQMNSVLGIKDSLYFEGLKTLEKEHLTSPASTWVTFAIGEYLNDEGNKYDPLKSDRHKWDKKSALEYCEAAIKRFPDSEGAKNCKVLANGIRTVSFHLNIEEAAPPEKPFPVRVEVSNVKELYFRLIKINPDEYSAKIGHVERKELIRFITSFPALKAWKQTIPSDDDYQKHSVTIAGPPVDAGFYLLLCAPDEKIRFENQDPAYASFWSTRMSYISKENSDGSADWFVLDRETGLPLKDILAQAWEERYNYTSHENEKVKTGEFRTDDQGYIHFPPNTSSSRNSNYFFRLSMKDDLLITQSKYHRPVSSPSDRRHLQTLFYTDRAIYRPGQTLYFKGIILERTGDSSRIQPDRETKVIFTDANGQKITEQMFRSNEFGSFNGSFSIPTGRLLGEMTIHNESGSVSVSVEEYKRLTFEVVINPLEGNYKLNETMEVTGKAMNFAGNAVDGGTVKFRVVRTVRFPLRDWGWFLPITIGPEVEITNGTTKTDSAGNFTIGFRALPDLKLDKKTRAVFDFTVNADITDLNGETQSVQQTVSVGYISLLVENNLNDKVNLLNDSLLKVTTTNLNGRLTPSAVTVSLIRLRQPDRAFKSRLWPQTDLNIMTREEFHAQFPYDPYANEDDRATWPAEKIIFEKTINTLTDSIINLKNAGVPLMDPGSYALVMSATDPFGEKVETKGYFTAFNPDSREVPEQTIDWFVALKTKGAPGENVSFLIGSKEDNVNVIYEIRLRDTLVSREWIKINDRAIKIEIPIRERYRGNFSVNFMFVKHNRVFQNSALVTVPYINKNLDIRFETFRNKLDPGAREEWKIKISGADRNPVRAEFLTAMYDASLDQFRTNTWLFPVYQRYNGIYPWDVDDAFRIGGGYGYRHAQTHDSYINIPELKLNWFGLSYFSSAGRDRFFRGGKGSFDAPLVMGMKATSESEVLTETLSERTGVNDGSPMNQDPGAGLSTAEQHRLPKPVNNIQIRKNFNETAFFYPSMVTDSTGSLLLSFTVPESLTRWKLSGLAHTQNLEYGLIEKEVVTRNELMVFPNVPRFVRQGDTVVFATKVVNLSDRDISGDVAIELVNAITLQKLDSILMINSKTSLPAITQPITLSKDQSAMVFWTLIIPVSTDLSLLQYRITAQAGTFSDGEEKMIPVLTNRMMVTESLPLPVRGMTSAVFSFDKLIESGKTGNNSLKNYRLTLEFATNPAWYAIQALPSLNDKPYQNADAIFNAFYSNSIAAFIANSNPSIKAIFESWKTITPDALQSNLEKNEELKSAMLQETPWVLEAQSESAQKRKLGLYFDLNTLEANLQDNLQKLLRLQKPSGGWTWFEGMPESRWITQNIITGLGHLDHLGITGIRKDPAIFQMVQKGIQFLDEELVKDYRNLKQIDKVNLDDNHLSSTQIQYLYARSYFLSVKGLEIDKQHADFKEAFSYYRKQAEKYWINNDRYLQGMIALALHRLDNEKLSGLILQSLTEKALHSDEMGMYWATDRDDNGYRWYQAPVETQAMMIEAFDEILKEEKTVEELKIWLLKQKQTQLWRTGRATVEACYALLLRGADLLGSASMGKDDQKGVVITLGKHKIDSDKLTDVRKEAGTGYFKMSWQGDEIMPTMGNVKVTKTSEGIAWGALYWQYFEDLDKISPAATPLRLNKKVYVERTTPAGPVLDEIASNMIPGQSARIPSVGDKLVVRIILTADRDLEFVHMKDLRASACEPLMVSNNPSREIRGDGRFPRQAVSESLSGYRYQEGLGYYQTTSDLATNFFFEYLPKGNYVFEYELRVNAAGDYSNGITTVQCLYAPEYSAHSEGIRIRVK